jgi:hypothetical protein
VAPLRQRVQWPTDQNGAPQGIRHWCAALALVHFCYPSKEEKPEVAFIVIYEIYCRFGTSI